MTSELDLFRAMREAIDDIRERAGAIEEALARAQIYRECSAVLEAASGIETLQSATARLQAMLDRCRRAPPDAQPPPFEAARFETKARDAAGPSQPEAAL